MKHFGPTAEKAPHLPVLFPNGLPILGQNTERFFLCSLWWGVGHTHPASPYSPARPLDLRCILQGRGAVLQPNMFPRSASRPAGPAWDWVEASQSQVPPGLVAQCASHETAVFLIIIKN